MSKYNKQLVIALREKVRLGSKTFQMLLAHFQSLDNLLSADLDQLMQIPRITRERAIAIREVERHLVGIDEDLDLYRESGIQALTIFDDDYPALLREISDPPLVLYSKGHFPLQRKQFIAMVGTTQATAEGLEIAVKFSMALSQKGAVIVSGLARGIDTAAHLGAMKSEGESYAVLGCGFNHIYPPENKKLAQEILEKGALISEYPPHARVNTGRLLARNRIIVGLSQSVVVGEIDKKSRGSINAADPAMMQGKLLFAVGSKTLPIDPGLIDFGAIPLDDLNKAELISNNSF